MSIENDWQPRLLGEVATLQRGFDLPHRLRRRGDVPIVTSSGLEATHNESRVRGPGVVTGRYGTIGQVFYVDRDFWPLNTTLYVKDFHDNDPLFISYLLRTIDFATHSGKSGVPGVNRNDLHELTVSIPRTRAEQEAIAGALADADAWIESLEKLIAKKRQVKLGILQQLLTAKRRLPGFNEEWRTEVFSGIAAPRTTRVDPRQSGTTRFCVELEHIESSTGRLLGHTETGPTSSLKTVFERGDVLFGKLRAYLRKFWLASRNGVCSTEIWALAPRPEKVISEFLYQLVTMDDFIETASTSYGTHMPRSDWSVVGRHLVRLPKRDEQAAIGVLLGDMDSDIVALEAKRGKAMQIKQGMMQVLLSGKVRLQ